MSRLSSVYIMELWLLKVHSLSIDLSMLRCIVWRCEHVCRVQLLVPCVLTRTQIEVPDYIVKGHFYNQSIGCECEHTSTSTLLSIVFTGKERQRQEKNEKFYSIPVDGFESQILSTQVANLLSPQMYSWRLHSFLHYVASTVQENQQLPLHSYYVHQMNRR